MPHRERGNYLPDDRLNSELMSSASLARLSGVALAIGAVVGSIGHLFGSGQLARHHGPAWIGAQFAMLVGGELMLLGLPALYRRQSGRLGVLGLISFVLLFGGLLREVGGPISHLWEAMVAAWPEVQARSVLPQYFSVVVVLIASQYAVGVLAFGVSVIRARVFSRGAGALLIAGFVVENLGGLAMSRGYIHIVGPVALDGGVVVLAALGWLGLELASDANSQRAGN